jgi:D-arabinose 1-dehydrogenase-like Zn-dependent alcohol dehydrogenase
MKHLVLTQFGTPSVSVALHDGRDPASGPRDVLVRMEAAAVNPSDLLLLRGLYFARPEPLAPVGGEGVGMSFGICPRFVSFLQRGREPRWPALGPQCRRDCRRPRRRHGRGPCEGQRSDRR